MKARRTITSSFMGIGHIDGSPDSAMFINTAGEVLNMYDGYNGHYGYPDFPDAKAVGGGFILNTQRWNKPLIGVGKIWRGGLLNQSYEGSVCPSISPLGYVTNQYPPDGWGTLAYNRMKPTAPDFQALNAIYELRELPGQLRQRFLDPKHPLKSISSYWLALQFGWKPLLNDCRNLVLTQMGAQKRLKQLLRDNGKPVRRKVVLLDSVFNPLDKTGTAVQGMEPGLVTQFYKKASVIHTKQEDYDRVWASARFRYWLPDGPQDIAWKRRMLARIFGLNPSPSVVWNAMPWTWLADWFVDTGSLLENMEGGVADRCAADYFYIMRERGGRLTSEVNTYYARENGDIVPVSGTSTSNWSNKYRSIGDPFGWNTTPTSLGSMQLSILGALGMSKIR